MSDFEVLQGFWSLEFSWGFQVSFSSVDCANNRLHGDRLFTTSQFQSGA